VIEKSGDHTAFYRLIDSPDGGPETFDSLSATAGPWSPDAQHGGPPAALLGRAVERLAATDVGPATIGRFTMELLGPVPVGPLAVTASVVRPGRSVQLLGAELYDAARGRVVASARAWLFPVSGEGPLPPTLPDHKPDDGVLHDLPDGWHGGYLDAVEWRWIAGAVTTPGPGVAAVPEPTTYAMLLAGLLLMALSRPPAANASRALFFFFSSSLRLGGTMSRSTTSRPALAKCAAMPLPITPAPITPARRIGIVIGIVSVSSRICCGCCPGLGA